MPPKTKKPRLERYTSEITSPPVAEPSDDTTTEVKEQSSIGHDGNTRTAETSTLEWHNMFQREFKVEEDAESTSESEADSSIDVKEEFVVKLEEVEVQNDNPEQHDDPPEDDDSEEEYTGDCFDEWDESYWSDGSLPGGSSDEDIVFSTSCGSLSRRELRKIEEAAERFAELDYVPDDISEEDSGW